MDPSVHYRGVAAGYNEGIRNTDAKAFIGVLFTATMMATVVGWRSTFPSYLPPLIYVTPFLIIFFCLMISVFPRFPRSGRVRFPVTPNANPDVFLLVLDRDGEREELPKLCAMFARILYWKTITLQISYFVALILIVAAQGLLVLVYFYPSLG